MRRCLLLLGLGLAPTWGACRGAPPAWAATPHGADPRPTLAGEPEPASRSADAPATAPAWAQDPAGTGAGAGTGSSAASSSTPPIAPTVALTATAPGLDPLLPGIVVFQSDFGLADGAVSAMHGVARGIERDLILEDLSHDLPPFDLWAAAYRLLQAAPYWPVGTVFVSVVDPGVGTDRRSVVLRTKSGHYFVSPDNGSLDLVAAALGIDELREIDEERNRRAASGRSYTFHGRDVYAYTGARLAAGVIAFEAVGPRLEPAVVTLGLAPAHAEGAVVLGSIPVLDVRFGNVWTDVGRELLEAVDAPDAGSGGHLHVRVTHGDTFVWEGVLPLGRTFGDVPVGEALAYWNSLEQLALGVNQGSFAERFGIGSGAGWHAEVRVADHGTRGR